MSKTADLIDSIYALTVDTGDYAQFIASWDEISATWLSRLVAGDPSLTEREQQALLQHFMRAEQIMVRMTELQQAVGNLQAMLDANAHPAMAIDDAGQIVALNEALRDFLPEVQPHDSVSSLLSILLEEHGEDHAVLQTNLLDGGGSTLVLVKNEPCLLVALPISGSPHTVIHFSRAIWHDSLQRELSNFFGLSSSEVAICALLYEGYDAKEIAARRSRAEDTIRKQIKSILAKTRCGRQADLMRLLTGMLVLGREDQFSTGAEVSLLNSRCLNLPDGRELYYYLMQPEGLPQGHLVITHGIGTAPLYPSAFTDPLLAQGFAIIGICRAGYGRSSPLQDDADSLKQSAEDLGQLLDHLGVERANMLTLQTGAMYAHAAAAYLGQRVRAVVCLAPLVPIVSSKHITDMPKNLKVMARTRKYFPSFFPLLVQSVISKVEAGEVTDLYRTLYKGAPTDSAVLETPTAQRLLDVWMRFCGAQGTDPYTSDAEYALSDWSHLIEAGVAPVLYIHGNDDQTMPRSTVEGFAQGFSNIEMLHVPGVGQLMIFARPQQLAVEVIDFVNRVSLGAPAA